MSGPKVGVYLFASDYTRQRWIDTKGTGMLINGCSYSRNDHKYTDTHGNTLYLAVASNPERFRGWEVDRVETMDPVQSERMFAAWEILKSHVRQRPSVVQSGQEGYDYGQELDTGSGEASGGATLAARSPAGRNHPQEQVEGGDRRSGRAASAEAGQPREDAGRIQPGQVVCNHCGFAPDAHPMPGCCLHPHEVVCS